MAVSIETQVSESLRDLNSVVVALENLGSVVLRGEPDAESYQYLCQFLGSLLQDRFDVHSRLLTQKIMPLVYDLSCGVVR